jgi:hypothetical protein
VFHHAALFLFLSATLRKAGTQEGTEENECGELIAIFVNIVRRSKEDFLILPSFFFLTIRAQLALKLVRFPRFSKKLEGRRKN